MEIKTMEEAMGAVKHDGMVLQHVPESLKTKELCMTAVKTSGRALHHVPDWLKMPEVCMAAVRQDGMALEFVPEALRTEKVCRSAVKQDGCALRFVPESIKTPELCAEAAETEWRRSEKFLENDENERINWVLESGIWEDVPDTVLAETLRIFEKQTGIELDMEPVDDNAGPTL